MRSLLAFVFAAVLAVCGRAQHRHVTVQLESGETIAGAVVSMDLACLKVQVGDTTRTIDAARIRSCRFDEADPAAAEPAPEAPAPAKVEAAPTPAKPVATRKLRGPLPDPVDPSAQAPVDLRNRSLLRARLERLDEAYPWLHPTESVQWVSLSLLLWILLSLGVCVSARVAGAENVTMSRSAGLALWYMVTGFVQAAIVPCNDFTVVLMLLANPALALFWLVNLFGLLRINALIAFAAQLGICVLGYGTLELITAVLASVTPAA